MTRFTITTLPGGLPNNDASKRDSSSEKNVPFQSVLQQAFMQTQSQGEEK